MTRNSILALALGGLTLSVLPACKPAEDTATTAQENAVVIKVFNLRYQEVTDYGEWFGYLRGEQDTDIHPRISGFLISQEYKNGTRVKAGDVLFRIDPKLYEAELERSQANLQAAKASLTSAEATAAKAKLDVKRYTQLVTTGSVSEKDLTDAQQTLKAAKAQVEAAKAQIGQQEAAVQKARINLDYTVIRAPYDGIVGTADVSIGDLVSPASKLTNITSIDPIRVDFSINGDHLINIFSKYGNIGTNSENAPAAPQFQLLMEDGSALPHKGTLVAMDSVLSPSGLVNVQGTIPNPDNVLRGGMPVRVKIPLHTGQSLLVPKLAIRNVLLNNFIIVVDKENLPHMIPVNIGGEYQIRVNEENGYHSTQTMVSVKDYGSISLIGKLKEMGYENPADALVVTDSVNAVHAVNVSSANSRLTKGEKPTSIKTEAFTFKPAPNPALAKVEKTDEEAEKAPDKSDSKAATMPPFPVKVCKIRQQDVAETGTWFGSLRGVDETDIRPQVSGFLLKQHFKDGSMVKAGDVLFTIDPAPYQATLDEARANLVAAKAAREQADAQLTMSRQNLDRYVKLRETTPGAISDKVVTDSETLVATNEAALRKADAAIAQMQAAVHQAEINLGYTTITAPFDGRIGIHKASIGALVSSNDPQPLVTLSSVNPMRVDFGMSGRGAIQGFANYRVRQVTPNAAAQEFDIILDDNVLYPKKGHVVTANNTLSTSTGTLEVIGHVENDDAMLRSGMAVTVRAKMKPIQNACLVPARAPLNAKGMDLLVLLRPDNTPQMLPITKGPMINLMLDNGDGKEMLQPMQVIEPNREIVAGGILAKTQAPNLESIILGGAKVKDWGELILKNAGADSFRALLEKQAGQPLPDDAPAKAGVSDWGELLLRKAAANDFRELVLRQANAKDELDLMAMGQGCKTLLDMVLKGMGFESTTEATVVVEGSIAAAQVFAANEAAGAPVNILSPVPFIYEPTKTVTPSVTAEPVKEVPQY